MAFIVPADIKLGPLPDGDVAAIEARYPGFVAAACASACRLVEGRLRKRYVTPIAIAPEEVKQCAIAVASWMIYMKRGVSDESSMLRDELKDERDRQLEWLTEVANSETGLIELALAPLDEHDSGVAKGGPFFYSEQDPYTWTDVQAEARRNGR